MESYLITAALEEIKNEMERVYWNKHQKEMVSPFLNTGEYYDDGVFVVRSYDWIGDNDLPNFHYGKLKCWWYKHYRRGLSWEYDGKYNMLPPSEFLEKMIEHCVRSINENILQRR